MDGTDITRWRAANRVKQETLAIALGVSRVAISKWENGQCRPSKTMAFRLCDIMRRLHHDELGREVAFLAPLGQAKVLVRGTSLELVGLSAGFRSLWPDMVPYLNVKLRKYLVNEAATYCADNGLLQEARSGDLLMVSGVSHRLLDLGLPVQPEQRVRWHAIARRMDGELVHEVVYEDCAPSTPIGLERTLRLSDILETSA
jgi:DNA-binding XRE family transcriptional regulator